MSISHTIPGMTKTSRQWPSDDHDAVERMKAEVEIKDLLSKYAYCYDLNDIDGLLSICSEDCVFVTGEGTFIGKSEIRRQIEYVFGLRSEARHFTSNVMVRVSEDIKGASLTAYYWYLGLQLDGPINGGGGTYESELIKEGNEWKLKHHCITTIFSHSLPPVIPREHSDQRAPPRPTLQQTSLEVGKRSKSGRFHARENP